MGASVLPKLLAVKVLRDEEGQRLVEYGTLLGFVTLARRASAGISQLSIRGIRSVLSKLFARMRLGIIVDRMHFGAARTRVAGHLAAIACSRVARNGGSVI
jgi:Flp pilus assembly pilin Flp